MRILINTTNRLILVIKDFLYSNEKVLRILFIMVFALQYHSEDIFAQQFLNSKEVKLMPKLKEIWEYKTKNATLNYQINSSICYINTIDGIVAFSLSDGKELWKHNFPLDNSISSVVTFSDKFAVYVNYKNKMSNLILIDLSNGSEKWHIESKTTLYKPTTLLNNEFVFCVEGSLVDWDDQANFNEMKFTSSKVKAFNIYNGKLAWEIDMQDSPSDLLNVDNNYMVLSFDLGKSSNEIMCLEAKSGNKKWEYNPSGMKAGSVIIGGVKFFNNALYTYPQYGGKGTIARIDVTSGDERWLIRNLDRQRNFIITNNKIYNVSEDWQSFNPNNGEEIISKSLLSSNFLSDLLSEMGKSIFLTRVISVLANYSYYFPGSDRSKLKFMPTIHLLKGLQIEDVVNNEGFFSIIKDDDEVYYKSTNLKEDGEEFEIKFTEDEKDLCLSNGSSDSLIFLSSKGIVYSINFKKNTIQWQKDFSKEEKELSIGLVFSGDKLLLFTNKRISALVSE